MNRSQRRRMDAQGLAIFLFFRTGPGGKSFFYPVEIPPGQLQANIDLNPGTIRVEDIDGNVVWRAEGLAGMTAQGEG